MILLQKDPFDDSAVRYDSLFTNSTTGMEQRKIVWRYLGKRDSSGIEVLEINCGTGEDAFFLTKQGCKVLATDASSGMISQCIIKSRDSSWQPGPVFKKAAYDELETLIGERKFDLVFSDFSGLNCVNPDDLKRTSLLLHTFLKPGGRMIVVVFGKRCLWEKAYFLYKGRFSDINRRSNSKPVIANLSGSGVRVFYYSGKELTRIFKGYFKFICKKPVGLFIPPSFLDPFFGNKQFLFRVLAAGEKIFGRFSFFSDFADHYIIEFKKV